MCHVVVLVRHLPCLGGYSSFRVSPDFHQKLETETVIAPAGLVIISDLMIISSGGSELHVCARPACSTYTIARASPTHAASKRVGQCHQHPARVSTW